MRGSVVGWGLPAHSASPWATWVLDRAHRGLKPALAGAYQASVTALVLPQPCDGHTESAPGTEWQLKKVGYSPTLPFA